MLQHVEIFLNLKAASASLIIQDDGVGFDPGAVQGDHFGTHIMRERAAAIGAFLSIDSSPGKGTRIQVEWQEDQEVL
jgi:two-component system, NarL family, nitrate/nitrite sensor histidine kinase NarX